MVHLPSILHYTMKLPTILLSLNFVILFITTASLGKMDDTCVPCDPLPPNNLCDITTSCINTPSGKPQCACRAGFKAEDEQTSYRLAFPGQEYRVFVPPGVACNKLCDDPFWKVCGNVPVKKC